MLQAVRYFMFTKNQNPNQETFKALATEAVIQSESVEIENIMGELIDLQAILELPAMSFLYCHKEKAV